MTRVFFFEPILAQVNHGLLQYETLMRLPFYTADEWGYDRDELRAAYARQFEGDNCFIWHFLNSQMFYVSHLPFHLSAQTLLEAPINRNYESWSSDYSSHDTYSIGDYEVGGKLSTETTITNFFIYKNFKIC